MTSRQRPDGTPRDAFQRVVRARLKAIADPAVAAGYTRYFKHQVLFLGVRTSVLRRIAAAEMPRLDGVPVTGIVGHAMALLRSPWMEERQVGVLVLHRHRKALPLDIVRQLAAVVDENVADWATCDAIAGRVLRYLIARDARFVRDVVSWSRSPNQWRQRAAAVAFLASARRGQHANEILTVCGRVVKNPERFAQLGLGWVLRELYLTEPESVIDFLARHRVEISREGLRYAIEKMPDALQRRLLDEHRSANPTRRPRPARPAAPVTRRPN